MVRTEGESCYFFFIVIIFFWSVGDPFWYETSCIEQVAERGRWRPCWWLKNAMLCWGMNRKASSGLPRKIETGRSRTGDEGGQRAEKNQKILSTGFSWSMYGFSLFCFPVFELLSPVSSHLWTPLTFEDHMYILFSVMPSLLFFWQSNCDGNLEQVLSIPAYKICLVLLQTIIRSDSRACMANVIWISPDTTTWIRKLLQKLAGQASFGHGSWKGNY